MTRLYLDRIDAHSADIARLRCPHRGGDGSPFVPPGTCSMSIPGFSPDRRRGVHRRNRRRHERVPHRRAPGILGRNSHRDPTNPPDGSNPPRHGPATATSKAPSGIAALSAARARRTPTSPPSTDASPSRRGPDAQPSSPSNTPCSSPPGNMLTNGDFYSDPGARLLHRTPTSPNQSTSHQTTRNPRIPSHLEPLTNTA